MLKIPLNNILQVLNSEIVFLLDWWPYQGWSAQFALFYLQLVCVYIIF